MHLTDETLESYELGRLAQSASDAVEDHLLVCEACRTLDEEVRTFIATARVALRRYSPQVAFWQLHSTGEGLVEIWVEETEPGWTSFRRSRKHEIGVACATMAEALRELEDYFRRSFPGHKCGADCMGECVRGAPPARLAHTRLPFAPA